MRLIKFLLIPLAIVVCMPFTMLADDNQGSEDDGTEIILPLLKKPIPKDPDPTEDPINPPAPIPGQRVPGKIIYGYISQSGDVQLGLDEKILEYEIWDAVGETLIASFVDEMDFVDYLFNFADCYTIRIVTDSYYYIGNIDTSK